MDTDATGSSDPDMAADQANQQAATELIDY